MQVFERVENLASQGSGQGKSAKPICRPRRTTPSDQYTVACRLREQAETKDATIIAVTGFGMEGDKARAKAAGFDFHVLKPASVKDLFPLFREPRPNKPR